MQSTGNKPVSFGIDNSLPLFDLGLHNAGRLNGVGHFHFFDPVLGLFLGIELTRHMPAINAGT